MIDERLDGLSGDDRIVQEARINFQKCRDWQGDADNKSLDDEKFAIGDSRNQYQWPTRLYDQRDGEDRPCLTINKVRIHNDIIINEAMRNRASIKVRPTGGKGTYEGSQVMQAIIRRIEYLSKASVAYNMTFTKQVDGGVGYCFLETAYANNRTFDQEIYIRGCRDPRCVYLDPDIREPDGSDARHGFIFESIPRDRFNKEYPKFKDKVGSGALGNDDLWLTKDNILRATYYRKNETDDTFISYVNPESGERVEKLASEIKADAGQEILDRLLADIESGEIDGRTRPTKNQKVEWFLIAGDIIVDRGPWAGSYVPIARCVGREDVIDGKLERKGHTRALIDAQRMLNYNGSAQVEFGALQSKSQWIGPERAFEGQEQWKDANRKTYAYLQYNDVDEELNGDLAEIDKPQRIDPPHIAPAFMQGMQDAERQIMMASGQYQAQLGENDQQSAISGKAINERQRQSDTATYHFVEHQGDMLRFLGVMLLDLVPKIYDTERTLHILGEDGTKRWIKIDPNQIEAIQELKKETDEAAELSFNPSIGEYDCVSDPGPNYATQRQEAFNAYSQIISQNMELMGIIGDRLFANADFPDADALEERMKKFIQSTKPFLFDDKSDPNLVAMQQQVQKLTALNSELLQKLAEKDLALKGRDERRDVEAFRAETGRMEAIIKAVKELMPTPAQRAQFEHEIARDAHQHVYNTIEQVNASELSGQASGVSAG